jgi:DNA-binding HxlR family transcriptional regulator
MLTLTTKRLCRDGLVERTAYPTIPPQVDYRLTEMGRGLAATISGLADWSRDNKNAIAAARGRWDADHADAEPSAR